MDIARTAQVSPILSAQKTAAQVETSVLKKVNDQIKAEGQAALQLIQSVPQASGNIGNNINIAV